PIQNQADGQKLRNAAFGDGVRGAIGTQLDLSYHAAPAAQSQESIRQERFPLAFRHAQHVERLFDRLQRSYAVMLQARKLLAKTGKPRFRRSARLAVHAEKAAVETLLAKRQRPGGKPLVQKRRAEANEQVVYEPVAVFA